LIAKAKIRQRGFAMTKKPSAIDLFCGAGGLSQGLRLAGFDVVGAIDLDAVACRTYKLNHKKVKLWEMDIRQLSGADIMEALNIRPGELALLAACPPCQGFSTMRTKNGTRRNRDRRNNLIFEVARVVRSLRPVSVMFENVPGLAKDKRYAKFLEELGSLGYYVKWRILNAADFNVPQRRRRLVLLASRLGEPQFALSVDRHATVRHAIASLSCPQDSHDPLHNYLTRRSAKIQARIRMIPADGGSRAALGAHNQLPCHKRSNGFKDVYGRMSWDKPAPTITCGCINPSKGRFLHPQADRAITLREAALLQTFPKTYRFPLDEGRYSVAELIGNALPPEFIRRHAQALRKSVSASEVAANTFRQ
jgi:DNA (cytosine-5)-methyltransferase 1